MKPLVWIVFATDMLNAWDESGDEMTSEGIRSTLLVTGNEFEARSRMHSDPRASHIECWELGGAQVPL